MTTKHARIALLIALLGALVVVGAAIRGGDAAAAASCASYPNQAAAQQAADTVDADGDGVYCETLPCPCARPSTHAQAPSPATRRCSLTRKVVTVAISRTRYPAVLAHIKSAVAKGWPAVTRIHREGADERRDHALQGIPTRPGEDRDEWPMAMARTSWRTNVAYVPSTQNRGAGAVVGIKLGRWCDGQRFRVVGY